MATAEEMAPAEAAQRIISERQRLGYTVAQFAVLLGISEAQQSSIEAGNLADRPNSYGHAFQRAGGDPLFMHGLTEEPRITKEDLLAGDEDFLKALGLVRKSQQAIDAFFGEGTSSKSPELVTALVNATMQERLGIGEGNWNDFVLSIVGAIEYAGEQIAEALAPAPDSEG